MTICAAPRPVVGLSAISPESSDTILIVSWSASANYSGPGVISQYYVTVTNYSLAPVTNVTVPGDITSTNVTGLGKYCTLVNQCSLLPGSVTVGILI